MCFGFYCRVSILSEKNFFCARGVPGGNDHIPVPMRVVGKTKIFPMRRRLGGGRTALVATGSQTLKDEDFLVYVLGKYRSFPRGLRKR